MSIGDNAFQECPGLTSINIPSSVMRIGVKAFYGCSGLTAVTIPEGVTSIEASAFNGCSGLTSIAIPSSVTSIGNYAFFQCSGLTSITIPRGVTSIGQNVFNGCSELTSVTAKNPTPVSISSYTFTNRTNTTLYVPAGSKADYEAADYWKEFKEIIELGDVNGDGNISITDVGLAIDFILENNPAGFDSGAADANGDGNVSITDVGIIIDTILNDGQAGARKRRWVREKKLEQEHEPQ